MGTQNSSIIKPEALSLSSAPEFGYRVMKLQESINEGCFKLNIMTDYVIGQDPRLIDLQQAFRQGQNQIQLQVFSTLEYKIRKVKLKVNLNSEHRQKQNERQQIHLEQSKDTTPGSQLVSPNRNCQFARRQYTVGVNFKYYPKINDAILRISKMFKNSPLQLASIKKDQYIVGVVEGQFTSMKQFVELVKFLIQSKFQFITLAISNSQGRTRLQRMCVKNLRNWKKCYGIGYLGIQLAEGWLNRWQLKNNVESNKNKHINNTKNQPQPQILSNESKDSFKQQTQNSSLKINSQTTQKNQPNYNRQDTRKEVDHLMQYPNNNKEYKVQNMYENALNSKQSIGKAGHSYKQINQQKLSINEQRLSKDEQTLSQSKSQVSTGQIQQKCSQLQHNYHRAKAKDVNVVKISKDVIQINFKDDNSTICLCKEYSKHCQKCFKEKEGNYYFFNKKTNKIILIQKQMLFPKKS